MRSDVHLQVLLSLRGNKFISWLQSYYRKEEADTCKTLQLLERDKSGTAASGELPVAAESRD